MLSNRSVFAADAIDTAVRDCPTHDKAGFSTKAEWFEFSYQLDRLVLRAIYGQLGPS
ncbi:hypothetical protein RHEC894_CH03447 [Rhizobium sp. CIAT894]|nr:hypothetical protein RHEC894_CH03447 [Rhizobium sp. CIAT894]